ncbi:DUF2935 domain-containing protein [Brevibacillus laterosporus]|uniref:DUF2935 domain-containing protein n=1 Tax=Brevibacillus laterosporus TaxID=1465 RepID=UPI000CE3ABC6|nr:DUF2935 domain-containing protein [Brevibacillus laterosporus]MED1664886.1 DUF2935 domain-containing protein [Brevibacillus laterosporus]MED1671468.1 DUF2935 domain-containing protein [Brevibacillus laterosporus]MED1717503.1 DUF2935 domain-containing protein [Brevibacillus laterosporus]PPA87601.1 hypothetical protein C4A76_11810 [Brevibacillus laterosporus]
MANAFVIRSLEEVRFWSRIMKEHSLFLKLGFNCDDTQLINEADHFYRIFENIEAQALSLTEDVDPQYIYEFNAQILPAVNQIWAFKRRVLGLIITCQIGGNNLPLLVDHVSREAAYFAKRLEQLNTGTLDPLPDAIINENVFFLKIMADHAKFINHLLDPSERKLVEQARDFSHDFDQLLYQAIDLDSMSPQSQTVPLLSQFVDQNRVSVRQLRDFKKTARDLIEACRIKSIIPPLLADHVFREASHFLEILDAFEMALEGANNSSKQRRNTSESNC